MSYKSVRQQKLLVRILMCNSLNRTFIRKVIRMKSKLCLLCAVAVIMSGCSLQKEHMTSKVTQLPVEKRNEYDSLVTLHKLTDGTAVANDKNISIVQKKYPDWFDGEGNILYPVQPGDKAWKKVKTQEELYRLVDIPKEIVDAIDTKTLLEAVEKYPLLFQLTCTEIWTEGAVEMSKHFYGFKVLLQRKDVATVAAAAYLKRDMQKIYEQTKGNDAEAWENYQRILIEEYLFSTKTAYEQMNKAKRNELINAIKKNYEAEKRIVKGYNPKYHFYDMLAYGDNPWKQ